MCAFQPSKRVENSHGDSLWSLCWCDGQVVTGSLEGTVKLWQPESGDCAYSSAREKIGITSVVALQDGSAAVACYQDSSIRFFDLANKVEKETETLPLKFGDAHSLSLSPGEDVLVSGSHSGVISFWSMVGLHEKVATIAAGSRCLHSTRFSVDGRLASGAADGAVYLHDIVSQTQLHRLEAHSMPVRGLAFSADGNLLFTSSDDRQAHLFDVRSGALVYSFSHRSAAFCVDASPDMRHVAVGCQDGSVTLWDLGSMRDVRTFSAHSESVWGVEFDKSCAGRRFASVGDDAAMQIYSL